MSGYVKNYNYSAITLETVEQILQLLEEENASGLQNILNNIDRDSLIDFLANAYNNERKKLFHLVPEVINCELILHSEPHIIKDIFDFLGEHEFTEKIKTSDLDDIVYIIELLPNNKRHLVLDNFEDSLAEQLENLLSYPENSAGRLMNPKIVKIMDYWTVDQTLNYLRNNADLPPSYLQIYVLNRGLNPVGFVDLSQLISAEIDEIILNIMHTNLYMINSLANQDEVAYLFKEYELTTILVTDRNNRLLGNIEVNNILSVVAEQAEEEYLKMAGVENQSFYNSLLKSAFLRLPWLIINLFSAILTSKFINYFSDEIEKMVILATIMPIIASIGGNAGTQTLTVIIRAIATKDLADYRTLKVVTKEVLICLFNALILSAIIFLVSYFMLNNLMLTKIFILAVIFNFFIAGLMGTVIPIILNKFKVDPALASSIILTSLTDIFGFCSFLMLARWLIL